ncbi:uncharacterized protein TNCV_179811 [Trichonephila clavipes]|nr:uncharacterized protein TNCV_179811 [Trichonephila clavipes]
MQMCPGKGLILLNLNIDQVSTTARFLLLSLPNNEMSKKSPFAIHKALIGIGGELKSVKRLRSGDLLIETNSAIQTKSFLLSKTFFNLSLSVTPHKSLSSCRGVISEPDLLNIHESEILEGFYDQCVTQPSSTDCTLDSKCVNCTQSHPSDSNICPKGKIENQIQEIKTNKNISYFEAHKLISQTYAQAAKPSTVTTATQTDGNIPKIVFTPLRLLQPLISIPKPTMSSKIHVLTKSSTKTQAHLLPPTPSVIVTLSSESQPPITLMQRFSNCGARPPLGAR